MTNAKIPHVHAEVIKAWADGAEVQYHSFIPDKWIDLGSHSDAEEPRWYTNVRYRVKPEPVIKKMYMHYDGIERSVEQNKYDGYMVGQDMYSDNSHMSNHLEFTFADNKLISVELIKKY